MKKPALLVLAAAGALAASPALAHPGHDASTLAAGLAHPFSGADHILAMMAVGLLAARRSGAALWAWPIAFVGAMLAGYAFGVADHGALSLEAGVLASVVVLGALTASSAQAPFALGLCVIGLSGFCHGFAHGAEAPVPASAAFPLGFAVSTAILHGLGLAAGTALLKAKPAALRWAGGAVALGGVLLALVG